MGLFDSKDDKDIDMDKMQGDSQSDMTSGGTGMADDRTSDTRMTDVDDADRDILDGTDMRDKDRKQTDETM